MSSQQPQPKGSKQSARAHTQQQRHGAISSPVSSLSSSLASCSNQRLARGCTALHAGRSSDETTSQGESSRPEQTDRSVVEMKSRRQSSGGSSAAACAAGEGNAHAHTHTHSGGGGGCSKLERKDVEKNRRLHMKGLCFKLSSLIPPAALLSDAASAAAAAAVSNPNKQDTVTQLDQLDSAAAYIRQLKERIEALKQRKQAGGSCNGGAGAVAASASASAGSGGAVGVRMPVIEVRYQDGTLDVVLITDAGRPFKLHEVITVLEQEGAEVVSASFSVIEDKIFYTIHSQALSPRIGLDAARVSQRLHDLLLLAPILV